jgi:hypothetical protein
VSVAWDRYSAAGSSGRGSRLGSLIQCTVLVQCSYSARTVIVQCSYSRKRAAPGILPRVESSLNQTRALSDRPERLPRRDASRTCIRRWASDRIGLAAVVLGRSSCLASRGEGSDYSVSPACRVFQSITCQDLCSTSKGTGTSAAASLKSLWHCPTRSLHALACA